MRLYELQKDDNLNRVIFMNNIIPKNISRPEFHELDLTNAILLIKNKCSEFLPIYKKYGPLYRGIPYFSTNFDIFIAETPINRIALSMPKTIQKIIDSKLEESGFTALRSNSIFCSGSNSFASLYGKLSNGKNYIIFPLNGFSFTYSEKIYDLFLYYSRNISFPADLHNNISSKEFVSKYKYTNKNLGTGIKCGNEILIHGKYIAINEKYLLEIKEKL